VTEPPQLDLDQLVARVWPLRIILATSAAIGVLLGLAIIVATAFAAFFMSGIGFFAMIFGVVSLAVWAVKLLFVGLAVLIVIPLAAAVATTWRLRHVERFILEDCEATPAPTNTPVGEEVAYMSHLAGLPAVPAYGLVENVFNAFAISSRQSVGLVLLGRPLARALTIRQALAILGHEIGHIAMRDSERKYLAIAHQEFLTRFLLFAGLKRAARWAFGLVGELALAFHSREREFWADAVGAYVTSPEDMIAALRQIDGHRGSDRLERQYAALMFRPVHTWLASHPPTAKRIEALERRSYLDRLPTKVASSAQLDTAPPVAAAFPGL